MSQLLHGEQGSLHRSVFHVLPVAQEAEEEMQGMSLKEWVKACFGSQDNMDQVMGWPSKTANRYLNHTPHRLFEHRRRFLLDHRLSRLDLVEMIDQREHELLVKQELSTGKPAVEAMAILSNRQIEADLRSAEAVRGCVAGCEQAPE